LELNLKVLNGIISSRQNQISKEMLDFWGKWTKTRREESDRKEGKKRT